MAAPEEIKYLDHDTARLYSPSESLLPDLTLLEISLNQYKFFMLNPYGNPMQIPKVSVKLSFLKIVRTTQFGQSCFWYLELHFE